MQKYTSLCIIREIFQEILCRLHTASKTMPIIWITDICARFSRVVFGISNNFCGVWMHEQTGNVNTINSNCSNFTLCTWINEIDYFIVSFNPNFFLSVHLLPNTAFPFYFPPLFLSLSSFFLSLLLYPGSLSVLFFLNYALQQPRHGSNSI